jgi:hypothetical protein
VARLQATCRCEDKKALWQHTGTAHETPSAFYMCRTRPQRQINPLKAELNPMCHLLVLLRDLTFMGPCIVSIFQYMSNKMQRYTVYLYLETDLHVFVVPPQIIRRAYNSIYSVWYLSHRYCYLPLSWKSWNRFECAVGGVKCNVASCWIYSYIGILLGAHSILHISRIKVKHLLQTD